MLHGSLIPSPARRPYHATAVKMPVDVKVSYFGLWHRTAEAGGDQERQLSRDELTYRAGGREDRVCRVGPGNFTPSPSQIRTGYSRIIRLVPSREGCRLPLNEGLFPANRLAQINGDDPPPSLQPHYRTFIATTRQSAPLRRIGTFGLAVGAACAFSLGIAGKVLTFRTGAWSSFALPTRRMPLGRYQDILRADPGGRVTPRF